MAAAAEIFAEAVEKGFLHGTNFGIKPGAVKDDDGTFTSLVRVLCGEITCSVLPEHGFDLQEKGFLDIEDAKRDAIKRMELLAVEISKQGAQRVQPTEN